MSGGGFGMLVLETVLRIRREFAFGKAIRAISRDLRLSRKVVRKAIRALWLLAFEQIVDPALPTALARHPQDGGGADDQKPAKICKALRVSRSGFHAWLSRAPSARARGDEALGARVRARFISSYRTYGARRVWHDFLAEGLSCGLLRVERLMRQQALKARPRRRGLPSDNGERSVIAGNVLNRQFTADAPNRAPTWPTSPTSGQPKVGCTLRP